MTRRARRWLLVLGVLVVLGVVLTVVGVLTLNSGWFRGQVRAKVVEELGRATGGSVSLGEISVEWRRLRFGMRDLVIRGTEPPSAAPLLRAPLIEARMNWRTPITRGVDVASLLIREPAINLIIHPDGTTNVPGRGQSPGGSAVERILDLAVGEFSIERGVLAVKGERKDFEARGRNLTVHFAYVAPHLARGPRYDGRISVRPLELTFGGNRKLETSLDVQLALEKNRLSVSRARAELAHSFAEASGEVTNFAAPESRFDLKLEGSAPELASLAGIRSLTGGKVNIRGSGRCRGWSECAGSGDLSLDGAAVRQGRLRVEGVDARSAITIEPGRMRWTRLSVRALGGRFTGQGELRRWERLQLAGTVENLALARLLQAGGAEAVVWNGVMGGSLELEGPLRSDGWTVEAGLAITPAGEGVPLKGNLDVRYDGQRKILTLGQSSLATPATHVEFSGSLTPAGEGDLKVRAESANLDDLLPVLQLVRTEPLRQMPVRLEGGMVTFEGRVSGDVESPQIAGRLTAANLRFERYKLDRAAAEIAAGPGYLRASKATLRSGKIQASLDGAMGLEEWRIVKESTIAGTLQLRGADITELLTIAGRPDLPVSGQLELTGQVSGTAGMPKGEFALVADRVVAFGQPVARAESTIQFSPGLIEVRSARFSDQSALAQLTGRFQYPQNDFSQGSLQFDLEVNQLALGRIHFIAASRPDLSGQVRLNARGTARVRDLGGSKPQFTLTAFDGALAMPGLRLAGRPVGNLSMTAATKGNELALALKSDFLNTAIEGGGRVSLDPGSASEFSATISQVSFATLRDWFDPGKPGRITVDGTAEGRVSLKGPAWEPQKWNGSLEISKFQAYPVFPDRPDLPRERLTLRNRAPLRATFEGGAFRVGNAVFESAIGRLEIAGEVVPGRRSALDLKISGALDLGPLALYKDWYTAGGASLNATVRGSLAQPLVTGRMELKDAAFSVIDLPAGIEHGNGAIVFSGSQANIENLTAEIGGGKVTANGFVAYSDGEFSQRIRLRAEQVRVRYPEGVSNSANARLVWQGTPRRSTVEGDITILRSSFNPRADLSSLLQGLVARTRAQPKSRTGPLANVQFDVHIETAPNVAFESTLAQDVQVEADLRLRGSVANPVLLGRLSVTQGEISFLGTKYTIHQGTVTFNNPAKLEPIVNLDLETKVRGIDVILTLAGPPNKLTVSHRADPPLDFSEVVALLATGRTPATDPTLVARQGQSGQQTVAQASAGAILSSAISGAFTNRLQRFFGVSKVKIDPSLSNIENRAQARITLEQQVSKNLTFTYITDVSRTNQQIIRMEWTLNRRWSVLATREENGMFGVDFLFKKGF